MMHQGLDYQIEATVRTVRRAGLYVSLCTIGRRPSPPVANARGKVDMSPNQYTPVDGLTNLKCMKAVWRSKPDLAAVSRLEDRFDTLQERHTVLDGLFPGILQRDLATIQDFDPTTGLVSVTTVYEIMAAEVDSQSYETRLALRTFVV